MRAKSLGLAGGVLWGVSMFITTLLGVYFGYGLDFLGILANIYPGYEVSLVGAVIGAVYGFFDAFIGLFVLAWLYNRF